MLDEDDDSDIRIQEMSFMEWYTRVQKTWKQGEHWVLIGQTGSGKTTLARYLLTVRTYVVVLAIKMHDDTIDTFKKPWHAPNNTKRVIDKPFKVIDYWPPFYNDYRVVLWLKPKDLDHDSKQRAKILAALNAVYKTGGWTVFLDDLGYLTGLLNLRRQAAVLLSQGRSNSNSIVSVVVQPSSVTQQVPTEAFRQVRHTVAFKFPSSKDVAKIAEMVGHDRYLLWALNQQLGEHDFLYFRIGLPPILVRNPQWL